MKMRPNAKKLYDAMNKKYRNQKKQCRNISKRRAK